MRSAAFGRRSGGPLSLGGFGPIHREKGKPPAPPRHFAILRIRLPRRMHRLETAFFDEAHKRICRRNAPHSGGSVLVPPPLPVRRERGECWFSYGDTRLPRRKHRLKTVAFSAKPMSESVGNAPHSGGSVLVPPPLPVRRRGGNGWFSYGDARLPRKQHAKESRAADCSYFGNGTVPEIYAERRHTGGNASTAAGFTAALLQSHFRSP